MLKFAQLATSVKSRYRAADAVTVVAASEQQERTLPGGQGRRSTYDGSIDGQRRRATKSKAAGGAKSCSHNRRR